MSLIKKMFKYLSENPIRGIIILWLSGCCLLVGFFSNFEFVSLGQFIYDIAVGIMLLLLIGAFIFIPPILTVYNIFFIFSVKRSLKIELITIVFGFVCTVLWCEYREIHWDADWYVQLYNSEIHTPVFTETIVTVLVLAAVALVGYLVLRLKNISALPPLVLALSISATYIGIAICIIWSIQTSSKDIVLSIYPFNVILIFFKLFKDIAADWGNINRLTSVGKNKFINMLHVFMSKYICAHFFSAFLSLPFLGIIIVILTLFGQSPDSIILAWTETADWTFSQQIAPQNITHDMHYLCTVAAGGHKKVVKPLRVGKRHGNRVLVNRQLCIANAFEQLLEERIPRIHRVVRNFYDKYGYPVAKYIRSPYIADLIWLLMKPLEWFFLAVLYLFDTKPENRIAVQYPHTAVPKVKE